MSFSPPLSKRALETYDSCIKHAMKFFEVGISSLAQGMAYWDPPEQVIKNLPQIASQNSVHKYGSIQGVPDLLEALKQKLKTENSIDDPSRRVYVTSGCNQAFVHILLSICDPGDEIIVFLPFYFNHIMAIQLANVKYVAVNILMDAAPSNQNPLLGKVCILESEDDQDIEKILQLVKSKITNRTRILDVINPGNPLGAVMSPKLLQAMQKLAYEHNIWMLSDETYEDFMFDGKKHFTPKGENVINLYSFSKSFGLAGWRVGYFSYPPVLQDSIDKVQDTNPINVCQLSQRVALEALQTAGKKWVKEKVKSLEVNRNLIWDAIKIVPGCYRTSGALYFMVPLPNGVTDLQATEYLAKKWKILVVPCAGCGTPDYIRVSYGNLPPNVEEVANRLKSGLEAILTGQWNKPAIQ